MYFILVIPNLVYFSAPYAHIYDPSVNETSAGFRKSLCKKFYKYELRSKEGSDALREISGDLPLLVIAHNYSRIGTDIDTAVHGLPGTVQSCALLN